MDKLSFFKKYVALKGFEKEYAFGKIDGDKKTLELLDGTSSTNLYYEGKNLIDGQLYRIYPATCDGVCEVGKPAQKCLGGVYSKNKCAIYSFDKINLDTFHYFLTMDEFEKMK